MYGYIEGKIDKLSPTWLYLNNSGIGYHINISLQTFHEIKGAERTSLFIREIIREALQYYAGGLTREDIDESSAAILDTLGRSQRMEVLHDLTFIAEADGPMVKHEKDMIELLAGIWKVDVHLDREEAGKA